MERYRNWKREHCKLDTSLVQLSVTILSFFCLMLIMGIPVEACLVVICVYFFNRDKK